MNTYMLAVRMNDERFEILSKSLRNSMESFLLVVRSFLFRSSIENQQSLLCIPAQTEKSSGKSERSIDLRYICGLSTLVYLVHFIVFMLYYIFWCYMDLVA